MSDNILGTGDTMPKIHCNHNESCLLLSECCRELQYTNLERYNLRKNNAFILEIYTETTILGVSERVPLNRRGAPQPSSTTALRNGIMKDKHRK